jgi:hypothetical protein
MNGDPRQQDAEYLKLLTIFHYVAAGMMALWGSFPIIHFVVGLAMMSGMFEPPKQGGPPLEYFGALFAFIAGAFITIGWTLAICTFFAGRNLARRQHYMYCLIMAGIMTAACTPFGTILGVFTIIVLLRPSVKESFGVASPMEGPLEKPIKEPSGS